MITKEQLVGMSFTEFKNISTFPRHNSFEKCVEANKKKICKSCGTIIHPKEMYMLIKRKFGGQFETHHIRCPDKLKIKSLEKMK